MENPFKRTVLSVQKPQDAVIVQPVTEWKHHCEALVAVIRKTGIRFHPNDQAMVDRAIEALENGQ